MFLGSTSIQYAPLNENNLPKTGSKSRTPGFLAKPTTELKSQGYSMLRCY